MKSGALSTVVFLPKICVDTPAQCSFNIKNHKQHCYQVIPDTVPIARVRLWFDPALIRLKLYLIVAFSFNKAGKDQREDRKTYRDEHKQ